MSIAVTKANQLVENINTAVLVFDKDLRLTRINTAGENLLSVSQRMVVGHSAADILPASPRFAESLAMTLKERQPYTQWGLDLNLNNEKSITVGCILTPLLQDDENCNEIIVELIDYNSFTRVMREENTSFMHDATRKSLSGLAHEIKNPLGGLRGAAQLLERELNGSELTEYTQIIINEADRLRNLVDRMLAPNGSQQLSRVNIHEILEYIHDLVQAEAESKINITRDYDPSLPDTEADREQLIQAFLNVVQNAVQAIGKNGHIILRTRAKRRCTILQQQYKLVAVIEIIDDGPGIPPEIEREIFYPLITGRPEGTGLGLSITQSLIQRHGGSIDYQRADNKTVFRILIPLSKTDEREK